MLKDKANVSQRERNASWLIPGLLSVWFHWEKADDDDRWISPAESWRWCNCHQAFSFSRCIRQGQSMSLKKKKSTELCCLWHIIFLCESSMMSRLFLCCVSRRSLSRMTSWWIMGHVMPLFPLIQKARQWNPEKQLWPLNKNWFSHNYHHQFWVETLQLGRRRPVVSLNKKKRILDLRHKQRHLLSVILKKDNNQKVSSCFTTTHKWKYKYCLCVIILQINNTVQLQFQKNLLNLHI